MKKNITPQEALKRVIALAKEEGISPSKYAENRGVPRYMLTYWKTGRVATIKINIAADLGIL